MWGVGSGAWSGAVWVNMGHPRMIHVYPWPIQSSGSLGEDPKFDMFRIAFGVAPGSIQDISIKVPHDMVMSFEHLLGDET